MFPGITGEKRHKREITMEDRSAHKGESTPEHLPHLAERLDRLFRTVPRSDDPGELHTSSSVAEALQAQGVSVTSNHIRAMRNGRRNNPSFRLLASLAELFHVPLDYFVDDTVASDVNKSLDALTGMRDSGVQQVMLRAHGVSKESLEPVLSLLDQIRRIEGLDSSSEKPQEDPDG